MDGEVTLELEGETYQASYIVAGDELTVELPDGSQRVTDLRGLKPEPTAKNHLRLYVGALLRNRST